jgi:hypothetical protein
MLRDLYPGSKVRVEVKDREGPHHVRRNSVRTACQNHVRTAREKGKGFNGVCGRGSWIRTNDLRYPKLRIAIFSGLDAIS